MGQSYPHNFRHVEPIYTYVLPSVKGFVKDPVELVFKDWEKTSVLFRSMMVLPNWTGCSGKEHPAQPAGKAIGEAYFVICLAVSTIDRTPMPK